MAISRTFYAAALVLLSGLGIASCITPPSYPETPEISFKSISQEQRINDLGAPFNNVSIVVSYKDGDGDLGLRANDTLPPFNTYTRVNKQKIFNPDGYNYMCQMQVRQAGNVFRDVAATTDPAGLNGRFPRLTPDAQGDRKLPLEGDMTLDLPITVGLNPDLQPGAVVRFRVLIKDRALNESNEILTDPITLPL